MENGNPVIRVLNGTHVEAWGHTVNPTHRWCARPNCVQLSSSEGSREWRRVCYIQAGGACFPTDSAVEMARRLLRGIKTVRKSARGKRSVVRTAIVRRGDVVLLNEGLHMHKLTAYDARERIRAFASEFGPPATCMPSTINKCEMGPVAHSLGVRVFWRETSPQAFPDNPNGTYSSTFAKTSLHEHCAPVQRPERPNFIRSTLATMEAAHVPILRTWEVTHPNV